MIEDLGKNLEDGYYYTKVIKDGRDYYSRWEEKPITQTNAEWCNLRWLNDVKNFGEQGITVEQLMKLNGETNDK